MALLFFKKMFDVLPTFSSFFPRMGPPVAQLSVVPVRWTHPQEVPHLDSHSAPGYIQKVGVVFAREPFLTFRFVISLLRLSSEPLAPHSCRLWECMTLPDMDVYGEIMQQADASALRLFEALVVTLPQTLLQTYVLICTDIGVKSPGSCRGNTKNV